MGHPKNKYERRRRDKVKRSEIAKDLHTRKYRLRTVEPRHPEDDTWKEDLQEYYGRTRLSSHDVLPPKPQDD